MRTRTDCRCCAGTSLTEVFSLGEQPYANAFLTAEQLTQPEPTAPLVLMECQDCGQVQLQHVVDGRELYRNYSFQTSSSEFMTRHFAALMAGNVARYVPRGGFVVEVGSNDGTALDSITRPDVRRLGIDPADNLAEIAEQRGVPTLCRFFGEDVAREVVEQHGPADLLVACNVLGHCDDLDDFCRGVNALLSPTGALIVEVPDVRHLIERTEFDTIYHEHLSYFSAHALVTLFGRHALSVERIEPQGVHGGSIRLTVRRGSGTALCRDSAGRAARDWSAFNARSLDLRTRLIHWLTEQRDLGRVVWGYGAPAKATVLLNYAGITNDLLPVIVDSTPTKQGRFVPGTHQPILAPDRLRVGKPDAAIIFPWNHATEIRSKESEYLAAGGQLLTIHEMHS